MGITTKQFERNLEDLSKEQLIKLLVEQRIGLEDLINNLDSGQTIDRRY